MTRALGRAGVACVLASSIWVAGSMLAQAQPAPNGRQAYLVVVDDATMEELLSVAPLRSLAGVGGAGLLSTRLPLRELQPFLLGERVGSGSVRGLVYDDEGSLARDGRFAVSAAFVVADRLREQLEASTADEALVVLASASPPPASEAAGDELAAVVVASGAPSDLAEALGSADAVEVGAVTSDSTRRDGVVTTRDVAATILAFLDQPPVEGDPGGTPIRSVDGPPPFELHERYLAQRRLYVPVGTAGAIYLALVGLLGLAFVLAGDRIPRFARRVVAWGCLSTAFVGAGYLAAGHLPELTYATVVPFLAIVIVLGTMAFSPLELRGAAWVPVGLGATVLAFFAVEAMLGWSGMLTPLLGGTHLDGGRFHGLPNVGIGLLIGASLYVAQVLPTRLGVALVAAVALFAGLPYLGSNLGAGVTLFATAGVWLAVRERGRLGAWRGVGVVALSAFAGAAVLLVAHRLSPLPTHVTRFVSEADGLAGAWQTFVDRLGIGIDLIRRNAAAMIPVAGLPLALLMVMRPPGPARASFERWPAWRDAVLVCLLGGVIAYLANDTGAAAAGFAFGMGLGGMLGVSLLAGPGKMGAT